MRPPVFCVESFKEKPAADVAETYLETGNFYWNSGIFLWSSAGVLSLVDEYLPDLARGVETIADVVAGGGALEVALAEHFPALPSISIDYGVLEKTPRVGVVEAAFDWDDVGSWLAVERYGERDDEGNSVVGEHIGVDTSNCIVVGRERLIATIGLDNVVVVETPDAILVCPRDQTERVRDVVAALEEHGRVELI